MHHLFGYLFDQNQHPPNQPPAPSCICFLDSGEVVLSGAQRNKDNFRQTGQCVNVGGFLLAVRKLDGHIRMGVIWQLVPQPASGAVNVAPLNPIR